MFLIMCGLAPVASKPVLPRAARTHFNIVPVSIGFTAAVAMSNHCVVLCTDCFVARCEAGAYRRRQSVGRRDIEIIDHQLP